MDATSFYVPRVPPAAPGDSPRSAGWSDPGTCQDYCFCSGSRSVRFCVHPFKSEDSISPSPLGLPKLSLAALQSQMLRGLVFLVQDPWAGEPNMGLRTLTTLGELLQL